MSSAPAATRLTAAQPKKAKAATVDTAQRVGLLVKGGAKKNGESLTLSRAGSLTSIASTTTHQIGDVVWAKHKQV